MINKEIADTIAKAVLITAESYEKRTGKAALRFLVEIPGEPPDPEPLPAENEITIYLSSYSVDVEVLETPTKPT